MDRYERAMIRARADWRAKRKGQPPTDSWFQKKWWDDPLEDHHVAGRLFGPLTIPLPRSVHHEMTRRQMDEHPPWGEDFKNPLEILARYCLGYSDIFGWMSEVLWELGQGLAALATKDVRDLE